MENKHIAAWNAQTEYACEYMHNGSKWCTSFFAIDDQDAAMKLQSIKDSLEVVGVIHMVIPVEQ